MLLAQAPHPTCCRKTHRPLLHRCSAAAYRAKSSRVLPCKVQRAGGQLPSSHSASDLNAAWSLLKDFTKQEFQGRAQQHLGTPTGRQRLREALLLAYHTPCPAESWTPGPNQEVLLGIVASDSRLALRALKSWCTALEVSYTAPDCKVEGAGSIAAVSGPVYVKYNSLTKVCYMSRYQGTDRGVLVQLGPGHLLGHFPLGFWDEQQQQGD